MATKTSFLELTKPEGSDKAQVSVINDNMDKIDTAVQNIDTAVQSVNIAVQQRDRVWNLLDNSDFRNPVNQRGQASYTGTGYAIDRWRSWVDSNTLTIHDGYITTTGDYAQYIKGLPGDNYSAFAMRTDGTLIQINTGYESANDWRYVSLPAGSYVWAALYPDKYTVETCPAYVPKGYAIELLECQRYFWRCMNTYHAEGIGYAYSNTQFRGYIVTPQTLRSENLTMAAATGDTTSYGIKVCLNSGKSVAPTAATIRSTPNRIMITLTGSFTSGELGVLRIESSYLDFSADL